MATTDTTDLFDVDESTLKRMLAGRGVDVPAGIRLRPPLSAADEFDEDSLAATLRSARVHEPLVVKLVAPGIVHKTELGAVRVGVPLRRLRTTIVDLCRLAERLDVVGDAEILVEEFVGGGVELFAGMTVDHSFGRVGVLGIGGVAAELQEATRWAALPLERTNGVERFVGPLLRPLRRLGAETAFLSLVSRLMSRGGVLLDPALVEVDLNPIVVTRNRVAVVDAWARTIERSTSHMNDRAAADV